MPKTFSMMERKRRASRNLDIFAEHLANGLSISEAARKMGLSERYGRAMMQAIKAWLGPQAV